MKRFILIAIGLVVLLSMLFVPTVIAAPAGKDIPANENANNLYLYPKVYSTDPEWTTLWEAEAWGKYNFKLDDLSIFGEDTDTDNVSDGNILIDENANFLADGVQIGDQIFNITDGSSFEVDEVVDLNTLSTTLLTDGSDSQWQGGDVYQINIQVISGVFNGHGLTPPEEGEEGEEYTLLSYNDPWGSSPQFVIIGSGTVNDDGNIHINIKEPVYLGGDVASPIYDWNGPGDGYKIWLVLTADIDPDTSAFIAWNPGSYLFENNRIGATATAPAP